MHIAESLCNVQGSDWENVICDEAHTCGPSLQPGEVLKYDCSGKKVNCPSSPTKHGNYTVKSGDTCMDIAERICNVKGNDWEQVICNDAKVCGPSLQPGEVLKYDCSGKKVNCGDVSASAMTVV